MTPAKIIDTIRRGARAHTRDHHAYGFEGDPDHHPSEDRSYGYLIWAGRSWT
jgi:hypothetical protein